jgi:hypothetical protein
MFLKTVKKGAVIFFVLISVCLTTFTAAAAQYGAAAVRENQKYTPAQMLTFALEDEYLAGARYSAVVEKFGNTRPFARFVAAEKRHAALLKPLMAKYNVPVPEDRSASFVVVPATLMAAVKTSAEAEKNTIRMYDVFIKQQLPDDVKLVFSLLRSASLRHLQAFERNLARLDGLPVVRRKA